MCDPDLASDIRFIADPGVRLHSLAKDSISSFSLSLVARDSYYGKYLVKICMLDSSLNHE
jgi:hypothetical protein